MPSDSPWASNPHLKTVRKQDAGLGQIFLTQSASPNPDGCTLDWTRSGRSGNALRKLYAVSPFMSGQHTRARRAMPLRAWFAQGADRVHPTASGSEQLPTSNRAPEMPSRSAIAARFNGSTNPGMQPNATVCMVGQLFLTQSLPCWNWA